MLTGQLWFKVPSSKKFVYHGLLQEWVDAKDLILFTIGDIGVDGALYEAMEFTGEVIGCLPMSGRFTMANMAVEAGGKNGFFEVADTTLEYLEHRAQRPYKVFRSDDDVAYSEVKDYDVSNIEQQVAFPPH